MKKNQNQRILAYLQKGKSITSLQALKLFGCLRLSGRIYDIAKMGHNIKSEFVKVSNGKRVAKYWLA